MVGSVLLSRRRASSRVFRLSSQLVRVSGLSVAACLCLIATAPRARAQSAHFSGITTQVGSGFGAPIGVAVDANGDVFVADASNHATTVKEIEAGTGGNAAGQISATSTMVQVGSGFNDPSGVAVDASGNVFVADTGNNAVKEIVAVNGQVSSSSTVNTVGSGFSGPMGVAVDGSGDVFVADTMNNAVKEIVAVNRQVSSTSTVNTVGSGFAVPGGVAVDGSGDVFVADAGNNAVKEIVAVNGQVTSASTVNTLGSGFSGPEGVAVDEGGDVFVADANNAAIKEILAGTGGNAAGLVSSASSVETLGSGFSFPEGVAVDGSGNVFATDSSFIAVYEIEAKAVNFGSVAVNTSTPVTETLTFTIDDVSSGKTLAAPVVLTAGATGKDFKDAGTGTCTTNGTAHAYVAGDSCTIVVAFTPGLPGARLGAVQLMNAGGTVIATTNVYGVGLAPLVTFPGNTTKTSVGSSLGQSTAIAVDGSGDVFLADTPNNVVKEVVAINGQVTATSSIQTVGSGFSSPQGVAVDGSGDVFVADTNNNAVKEIVAGTGGNAPGQVSSSSSVKTVGGGFGFVYGMAVDGSGDVFVCDYAHNAVKEIVAVNGQVSSTSTVLAVGSGFTYPGSVAVDENGDVFVADSSILLSNSVIKEIVATNGHVSSASTVKTVSAGGIIGDLAVDPSGDVYVADFGNNAIYEIVAGTGGNAPGQVSTASTVLTVGSGFTEPSGMTVDSSGNLYVVDSAHSAMMELSLANPPSLSFGSAPVNSSTPKMVTLANEGTANLDFTVPTAGLNPSVAANFAYDSSSTCSQLDTSSSVSTLAPGASCTLALDFVPNAVGSFTGSAVITDNDLNAAAPGYATQTISLSGTATPQGQSTQTITFPALATPVIYGAAPVTLTATATSGLAVTYGVTGPAAVSGSTLTFTGAGTVVVTANQIGNTTYSAATPVSQTITVNKATLGQNGVAGITLSSTPNSSIAGQSVTFTATVPNGATGTISFMNGTTSLGTGTISGTTATLSTTTLPVGTDAVTAVYGGDANYNAATSAVDSQVVLSANAPDFGLTVLSASSQTLKSGESTSYTLQVTPTGAAYPGTVSLTVTGVPGGASASFSTATIAADAGTTTSTLSIQTTPSLAMNKSENRGAPLALAVLLLPLGFFKRVRKNGRRYLLLFVVVLGGMAAATGLSGCFETAIPATSQTYNLTVTATSGTLQHSVNVTLIVDRPEAVTGI